MIYDYAIQPECLFAQNGLWHHHKDLGIASGRVIAEVAGGNWRETAEKHLAAIYHTIGMRGHRKLDEWLCNLAKSGTFRRRPIDPRTPESSDWISAVREANQRHPFSAIVSENQDQFPECTNVINKLDVDLAHSLWYVPRGVLVKRQVDSIACALRPLAEISQDLLFVEPYFALQTQAFGAIAKVIVESQNESYPLRNVEVHTELKDGQTLSSGVENIRDCFSALMRKHKISSHQPNFKVMFRTKLHDRFFLTELGGIKLSAGFGEAKKPDQEADLLTEQQWLHRWREYNTREMDYVEAPTSRASLCGAVDAEFELDCQSARVVALKQTSARQR